MEMFTANVATTPKCPLVAWHLMRNEVKIMNIMYINIHYVHSFANVILTIS